MKSLLSASLLFCSCILFFAQNEMTHESQAWIGYITQSKVSNKFSIWNDAHLVPNSFLVLRTGGTYHFNLNEKLKGTTTLGYAHLWLYPAKNSDNPTRNEHRPWGQTTLSHSSGKFGFMHRLRYDARFRQKIENGELTDHYGFNWRFRYFLQARYKLNENKEKGTQLYLYSFNEILYDAGKEIKNDFRLNQNRFTIGVGYRFNPDFAVQIGYLNMLKKSPSNSSLTMAHTASIMVFHNFDFTKN
ncbi:MAG: DUF2490 domain-containing protein [Cruoricaptor ignavus]|nr:DUF2490 domain-containing protein [Cruoricaptor ignavus]